jgi:asparagine synthetase A
MNRLSEVYSVSVEQTETVDVISVDQKTGEVILTVSDHLDWTENLKHQTLLQSKLNTYLRFVESGELLESYPSAKNRRIAFCVVFKFAPDQEAREFLARVQQVVTSAGIGFSYNLFAVSYDN